MQLGSTALIKSVQPHCLTNIFPFPTLFSLCNGSAAHHTATARSIFNSTLLYGRGRASLIIISALRLVTAPTHAMWVGLQLTASSFQPGTQHSRPGNSTNNHLFIFILVSGHSDPKKYHTYSIHATHLQKDYYDNSFLPRTV